MKKCQIAIEELPKCGKRICCFFCDEKDTCLDVCPDMAETCEEQVEEETELQIIQSAVPEALQKITDITVQMDKLKKQEEIFRQKLVEAMEQYGVKKFENEKVSFTYVAPTTKKTFDKKAFEKAHPEINLSDFDKVSPVKASVRISVK